VSSYLLFWVRESVESIVHFLPKNLELHADNGVQKNVICGLSFYPDIDLLDSVAQRPDVHLAGPDIKIQTGTSDAVKFAALFYNGHVRCRDAETYGNHLVCYLGKSLA